MKGVLLPSYHGGWSHHIITNREVPSNDSMYLFLTPRLRHKITRVTSMSTVRHTRLPLPLQNSPEPRLIWHLYWNDGDTNSFFFRLTTSSVIVTSPWLKPSKPFQPHTSHFPICTHSKGLHVTAPYNSGDIMEVQIEAPLSVSRCLIIICPTQYRANQL